jgi:hypothetical protein
MWLVIGLGLMGYLVGFLAGMTEEQVVKPVITLLFAFVGGSIFVLLAKLTPPDRTLAGKMLSALSICCVIGMVSGVSINQFRWLSPDRSSAQASYSKKNAPYLRSAQTDQADVIDQQMRAGVISRDDAYAKLYNLVHEKPTQDGAH